MYSKNKKIRMMYDILDKNNESFENTVGLIHKELKFDISKETPFVHFFIDKGLEGNVSFLKKHWDVGFGNGSLFLEKDISGTPAFFSFIKKMSEYPNLTNFLYTMKKISESPLYNDIVSQTDSQENSILHIIASLSNDNIYEYINLKDIASIIKNKGNTLLNNKGQSPLHFGVASNGAINNVINIYNVMENFAISIKKSHKDNLGKTVTDYSVINRNHIPFVCEKGYLKENITKDMIHAIVHNLSAYMRVKGYHDSHVVFITNSVLKCLSMDEKEEFLSVLATPHPYLLSFSKMDTKQSIAKEVKECKSFSKENISSNIDYLTENPKFCIDLYDNIINDIEKEYFEDSFSNETSSNACIIKI